MKMLFWTVVIGGLIWFFAKKKLGAGNDLFAHFQEQRALQSVGNSALGANQIGSDNFPLATIGQLPLAGINLDPFASDSALQSGDAEGKPDSWVNPFSVPHETDFWLPTPTSTDPTPFLLF